MVFAWDELKLINEILYDNVYLASIGVIFITEHPLVGSLRGRRLKRKGKGVLGTRETREARKEEGSEGNACQETIAFDIPPTNYVCKNNGNAAMRYVQACTQ